MPPPQSKVAFAVVDDAASVELSTEHVSVAAGAILTLGDTISCVTMAEAVAVQR